MKVRHIRRKPWLRKGPAHKALKKQSQAITRARALRYAQMVEACRAYMRPVL